MVEEKLNDRHRRINRKERRGEGSYRHNDNHIRKIKTVSLVFYGLEPEVLDVSLTLLQKTCLWPIEVEEPILRLLLIF